MRRLLTSLSVLAVLLTAGVSLAQSSIGWGNLQWPFDTTDPACTNTGFYGQVWVSGLTDLTPGPDGGIIAQLGFGPVGSTPGASWLWFDAVPNPSCGSCGNNDEYMVLFGSQLGLGTYHYTFRYQLIGETDYYYAAERGTATVTQLCGTVPNGEMSWGAVKARY